MIVQGIYVGGQPSWPAAQMLPKAVMLSTNSNSLDEIAGIFRCHVDKREQVGTLTNLDLELPPAISTAGKIPVPLPVLLIVLIMIGFVDVLSPHISVCDTALALPVPAALSVKVTYFVSQPQPVLPIIVAVHAPASCDLVIAGAATESCALAGAVSSMTAAGMAKSTVWRSLCIETPILPRPKEEKNRSIGKSDARPDMSRWTEWSME